MAPGNPSINLSDSPSAYLGLPEKLPNLPSTRRAAENDWEAMFAALDGFGDDFMAERRQPELEERDFMGA